MKVYKGLSTSDYDFWIKGFNLKVPTFEILFGYDGKNWLYE